MLVPPGNMRKSLEMEEKVVGGWFEKMEKRRWNLNKQVFLGPATTQVGYIFFYVSKLLLFYSIPFSIRFHFYRRYDKRMNAKIGCSLNCNFSWGKKDHSCFIKNKIMYVYIVPNFPALHYFSGGCLVVSIN